MDEMTATELKQRLDNGDDIQIIDVREDNEVAMRAYLAAGFTGTKPQTLFWSKELG